MRGLIRRAFVENAALKAISLVLAVALFMLVRGDKDTERSLRVAVRLKASDRVLVSEVPEKVDIWVRGPWTRIKRLDPNDVPPIVIDLSRLPDGDFALSDDMVRLPTGLRVVSMKPPKITLLFEHEKKLPVVVDSQGSPPRGFAVERVLADPPTLVVKGPKHILDMLTEVRTQPLALSGKKESFRVDVPLAPPAQGAALEAGTVAVEVTIGEEAASRTLTRVPVVFRPGALGVDPAPRSVEIILRGGRSAVEKLDDDKVVAFVQLLPDDLSGGHSRSAPVLVEGIPAGMTVDVHPREIVLTTRAQGGSFSGK